jgi:hypothetical protein
MDMFFIICMIIAMAAVLGVLVVGLYSMTRGGDFNKKYGNKLMQARVVLQGVALLMFALAVFASQT